jgi:predicted negative regulator of RcsB-dependent stress response
MENKIILDTLQAFGFFLTVIVIIIVLIGYAIYQKLRAKKLEDEKRNGEHKKFEDKLDKTDKDNQEILKQLAEIRKLNEKNPNS